MAGEMVASGAQIEVNPTYRPSTNGVDFQYARSESARDHNGCELGSNDKAALEETSSRHSGRPAGPTQRRGDRMDTVPNTRFGSLERVEVAEQEIITFPEGLPGFEDLTEFALIDPEGGPPPMPRRSSINWRSEVST
jgi:hypothetical protein